MRVVAVLGLAFGVAASTVVPAARAEAVRDAGTGLQVDAPPGYAARAVTPGPGQKARFEVKTPTDGDTGCQVAFTPAPQNKKLSQAQINAGMRGEDWREKARAALSNLYDVAETLPFQAGRREGVVVVADFKPRPQLPPRAALVRTLFVIQETPNGRTSTVCVGEKADFVTRRPEFLAVAAGATPP